MMDDGILDRDELLRRYALVGGPKEMIPLLERAEEVCAANSAVADLVRRHGGVPGIEHTRLFWVRKHADGVLFRFGNMEFMRGFSSW